jgi:hypothetical protein
MAISASKPNGKIFSICWAIALPHFESDAYQKLFRYFEQHL